MNRLRGNALANMASQVVAAGFSLLVVPLYLRHLGTEGFGLLGFGMLLQATVLALDPGIGPSVVSEVARRSARGESGETRAFFVTFERVGLCFSAVTAALLIGLAPWIGSAWLSGKHLSTGLIVQTLVLIGLQCGLQWLILVYQSVLAGLERQVLLGALRIAETSVRLGGSILLLAFGWAGLQGVLLFQLAATALFTATMCLLLHHLLRLPTQAPAVLDAPRSAVAPMFRWDLIGGIWRFGAAMAGISISGFLLGNLDRLLVSRLLLLDDYARYAVSYLGASVIPTVVAGPLYAATFPRFVGLQSQRRFAEARELFHFKLQVIATLVLPTATVLSAFGNSALRLWTRNDAIAAASAGPLVLLAWGAALNALMVPAFALRASTGRTRVMVLLNLALLCVFAPVTWLLVVRHGILGAAAALLAMNGTFLALGLPLTLHRVLPDELSRTVLRDIAPSGAVCLAAFWILRVFVPGPESWLTTLSACAGVWTLLAGFLGLVAYPQVRRHIPFLAGMHRPAKAVSPP